MEEGGSAHQRRARLDRVTHEASRIEGEVRGWAARRIGREPGGWRRARVEVLEAALRGALAQVMAAKLPGASASTGALYREALAQERRLAVVERLFQFFRSKFEQREDPAHARLLEAADQVVYSFYAPPFQAAGMRVPPPPLAYVEPAFSPRALTRDEPPSDLTSSEDVLRMALAKLPFGVVALPPWFHEGPWTLAYLAHEVGHHLQFDLAPGLALVKGVGDALEGAASAAGLAGADRFRRWGKEIFADAYSVVALGPAAIEAIVELEWGDEASMLVASAAYPSPAVRFATMTAFARAVGLDPAGALGEIDPVALAGTDPASRSGPQQLAADQLSAVPKVAEALAALSVAAGKPLATAIALRAADFGVGGETELWARALQEGKRRASTASLRGTRTVVAAAWRAWRHTCAEREGEALREATKALGTACAHALAANVEPMTLGMDATEGESMGHLLGASLVACTPETLGA